MLAALALLTALTGSAAAHGGLDTLPGNAPGELPGDLPTDLLVNSIANPPDAALGSEDEDEPSGKSHVLTATSPLGGKQIREIFSTNRS
ncbi:hypothetical protein ONE63_002600 [Megalurothrips usitatus]|uniref:Secreted protein n=1 Tax=Megalurothrips usitatus TaxID=439358 RepID=A0AAV7XBP5_9NEOP|nr:hypothetical protein ONE63_002600 [Megalurothrips usitatus]